MNKFCLFMVILSLLVSCLVGCKSHPVLEPNTESTLTIEDYEAALNSEGHPLHEKTTIECRLFGRTFQYAYELMEENDVIMVKDLETGAEYRSDEFEDRDAFFLRFGRLPPAGGDQFLSYELGEYSVSAEIPPEALRENLLQASSLFAGIEADADQITLNTCTYTAELCDEGRLCAYTYTAKTALNTTGIQFTADITLRVERKLS